MKTVVALLLMVIIVAAAQAEEFKWQGIQVVTSIGGEVSIAEDKLLFRSSVSCLRIPNKDTEMSFIYSGPKWIIKKWSKKDSLWLAPQVGVAGNWTEDGSDAVILSLWGRIVLFEGQFSLFVEEETYVNLGQTDYYAYYSADYHGLVGCLNIGAHLQQLNRAVNFGPHIGVTHGAWHSELRYSIGFQESNAGHVVRITTGLSF